MMTEKKINILIGLLGLIVIAGSACLIYYFHSLSGDSKEFEQLKEMVYISDDTSGKANKKALPEADISKKKPNIDLTKLYKENNDLAGWISIEGTDISYPVMYKPENTGYYINNSFSGGYSKSGVPFIDEGCFVCPMSDNVIIYGHNMKNGSMFAGLLQYKDENFAEKHQNIELYMPDEEGNTVIKNYSVFAVLQVDVSKQKKQTGYFRTEFENEDSFNEYIREVKENSLHKSNIIPKYEEKILTLCTCSYHVSEGRLLVIAKETY